jgi:hypothetical protein
MNPARFLHPRTWLPLLAAGTLAMAHAAPASAPSSAPSPTPSPLTCEFQAVPKADGQVVLHFTLRNAGPRDLQLLRWGSPFEGGWFGPFVQASTPQGELPFQGAMRKRGDPSAQDYLLLRAGQSLSAELQLSDAFAWPPAGGAAGPLHLKAGWHWHDVIAQGAKPPRPRAQHQGLDQVCGEATVTR